MRLCFSVLVLSLLFCQCETETFDKDKRQIAAKDAILNKLHRARDFEVTGFREDTLSSWGDSVLKQPIRYTLNFVYTDSTGSAQHKTGEVIFTHDGKSLVTAQIDESHQ